MSEQQQEYGGIIINGIDCSGGGGSSVTPNPPAPATETLSSLDINGVVYGIEQETRENIFSIFDTFNLNDDCSSGELVANDHFTFGINDTRNDWSGSTTIYNNNAYDLTDIDKLELVVTVTQQNDYAYLWLTFSNTKYTWGTSSWPGVYQNKTSALQISQSGSYEVDVSELTGNYYIYIGATSGKDDITPGDCNNTHNGVIAGTVTEFNIISSSMGTSVTPNPDGNATEVLKKIKIDEDIYKVADVEEVTEEQYSALPSTKNSDDTVYMIKHIEDIFDGGSTISLLGGNGITLESSSVTEKIGSLSAYEYSAGYEGFNIALQNLTVGQTYKLEFDFQFTSAQFIDTSYRCAYLISATQKTNYTDYTQWTENLPRDLVKHHHSVQFTASTTTMYIAFNLCGCSDNVNNYFTINNIYVINTTAQNKIMLNGNQYGTGSGGGTEVIANPTGTATADLNKISIGGIIYNIVNGGSGGAGSFESTTLYTGTQRETTINLSDDYTNYDYLVLQGYSTASPGYLNSNLISVNDITIGNNIGVADNTAYIWYTVTSTDTFAYAHASGEYYIKAIYGLKESEGGSGGYLTLVPCYAEFIEGFNNTYWNTHLGQLNAEYFLDFYIDQYQDNRSILGSSGGPGRLHLTMYSNKWYTSTGNGETSFGDSTMITGRHTFRWNTISDSKILFDEQDTGLTCSQSEVKDINIYINNRSARDTNDTCTNSRMYEFKITAKDGTVLHDFKPYALYAGSTLIWKGIMDVVGGMEADGWFNVKEIPGGGTTLIGTDIEANPSDSATDTLNTIRIGDTIYDIEGSGGGGSFEKKTTAEYQALPTADKENPDVIYFIDDSGAVIEDIDPTDWTNNYQGNMRISIIDNKLTYDWDGNTDIGALSVITTAIPSTVNKIKFKVTTATSYNTTHTPSVDRFKIYIGLRDTNSTTFFDPTQVTWLASTNYNTANSVWENELDLSNVTDSGYLYFYAPGWDLTLDYMQLEIASGSTDNCIYYQNIKYADNASSGNVDDVYVNGESVLDTNKIAQVKTHKEVSLAEYEDANDNIIYFVDDDDDELGIYYSPIIYSTEEREVGTWTNGKPLYEKTIYIGSMTKNSSWNPIAHNINNIEKVIKLCGQTKQSSDGRMYNIPHYRPYDNTGVSIGADTTYVYYMNTWLEYASDTYVTIQYTKTTDTAGSAKYNALGVPMVHYSTDEQVIGTWIDGKPLYQKTYYYDNQSGLIDGDNKIIQLDSTINVTKLNGFLVASDNNKRWILPYSKGSSTTAIIITDDHYINLYVNNDSWASTRKVYITIEYTKTTD